VAGRKVFTSGEILTAADVNSFLMDQSVMVFADSSARSSAIPSPSEGMLTYLEDTDAVEKYDGAAFVNVAPGGLVAVKSALKTDTFTASVSGGGNVAVTDLSITHEVSDPANRLIISAFFGTAGNSEGRGNMAIAVAEGGTLINVGDSASSRNRVTAGAFPYGADVRNDLITTSLAFSALHTPGSGSKTYTVRAINLSTSTRTLYVNRGQQDSNSTQYARGVSSIVIQEVAV